MAGDSQLAKFFDASAEQLRDPELIKNAANLILNYIAGIRKESPQWLPSLELFIEVVQKNLPAPQAKSSILSGVMAKVTDVGELPVIAQKVIDTNPAVVADYKAGKEAAMQFLVGQGMKASKGSANPQALREAIQKILG